MDLIFVVENLVSNLDSRAENFFQTTQEYSSIRKGKGHKGKLGGMVGGCGEGSPYFSGNTQKEMY